MLKQMVVNHLKNIVGWKTQKKIIVISVDDYGNVRLDSKKARENMDKAGLKVHSRFDALDTLETREDLEILFETLDSVKDKNDKSAIFSTFSMPCNIDFEKMSLQKNERYIPELLPDTFEKLTYLDAQAYQGTWKLWIEGKEKGLFSPQFHGREHLNLKVFEEKLKLKDYEVLTALNNRSYTSISNSGYKTINYTSACDFSDIDDNTRINDILIDGISKFNEVFGFKPSVFMPPTSKIHPMHLPVLNANGIKFIDTNLIHQQFLGNNIYSKSYNYTGKKLRSGQLNIVRNVVFEPSSNRSVDSVQFAMSQIEAAFFWNRPAILSSHRVNFCGHINPENRKTGILALKDLLKRIVLKWPEVEFMSANELGELMLKTPNNV